MNQQKLYLKNHNVFEVTPVLPDVVRIRCRADGIFKQTLTERYGLVETNHTKIQTKLVSVDEYHTVYSGELVVKIFESGEFRVSDPSGEPIIACKPFAPQEDMGVGGVIGITDGERFYGGGYRPNRGIELRGQIIKNWCAPVTNNGPSTFIMSSKNWGLFWNNTCETYFDFGCRKADELVFWAQNGEFDIFVFKGDFVHMIESYTTITGKPTLMPLFGYGITNVNSEVENEVTVVEKAERLRREEIPCDVFSISCEWMEKNYDKSVNKYWNLDRYFVPRWMNADQSFLAALKRFGIKATLWMPCHYDLTHEQERRYYAKHPEAVKKPLYDTAVRKDNNSDLSIDANSRLFRDDHIFPMARHDPYTVPEEPWFEHLKKFFDLGIVGVAEDGSDVVVTKIDHLYGNGYTYKEMQNLNQTLNALQYYELYREYTGKRIFVRTPSTFIGHQRFCGTWCGDTTSKTSLVGLIQYSFQGQSNVTADLISKNNEQIHAGMLMPWVLNFCWAHPVWPWMLTDELRDTYVEYARLRYALMPYVYTAAYRSHLSGLSMCTAMIIHYPDDSRFYDCCNQYMFGDSLLVGALSDEIHLPEGVKWIDYWTGREYEGGITLRGGYPKDKGGYLLVKKGSILPLWENILYVGQKPIDTMTVKMYPQDGEYEYALYEDDGISFEYEGGACAFTKFGYKKCGERVTVWVKETEGDYTGRPQSRTYHLEIYMEKPSVLCDGAVYDEAKGAVCITLENSGRAEV